MKKFLTAISVSMILSKTLFAQTEVDALRYSQLTFGGTARSISIGGATGAIGADFSSLSDNPAGIALFQSNQFMFSPGLSYINSSSTFAGNTNSNNQYNNFNIANFGLEGVHKFRRDKSDWRNVNFAFGMNRLANFNSSQYYSGFNPGSSLLDGYAAQSANQTPTQLVNNNPFDLGLAYNTYLINPVSASDSTHYRSITNGMGTQQAQATTTRGGISEYVFSMGGNYKDKLYIGLTIGVPSIHYESSTTYTETPKSGDSIPYFNSFALTNNLTTNGTGIDAKFGLIYRINDVVRIGGAIHSPTYYYLHDSYSSSMSSDLDTASYSATSPSGSFNYSLTTPWRAVGSIALVFKKYGFITGEYEFVDYSSAYYGASADASADDRTYLTGINQTIAAKFGTASNFKVGGELVFDIFRFRLGYDNYGSPFKSGQGISGYNNSSQSFTGGLGITEKGYFLDLGYARTQINSSLQPYTLADVSVPSVNTKTWYNNFVLTLGFKW